MNTRRVMIGFTLFAAAVAHLPVLSVVALAQGGWKKAEHWAQTKLPWWSYLNALDLEFHPPMHYTEDRGWFRPHCDNCGKPDYDVIYRDLSGTETLWCGDCFRTHHVPEFNNDHDREVHSWL